MRYMKPLLFICVSTFFAEPVLAEVEKPKSELEIARALVNDGKAADAMAKVDPIIAQAMTKDAKDANAICPGVAVAVLQSFMQKDNPDVRISVENDWCEAMLVKGYALTELKRFGEAEQTLGALVRHDPENAQYAIEYAFAVRSTGDTPRALGLYQRAEKLASRISDKQSAYHWRAVALRGQGFAHIELRSWNEAEKAYRKSLKYDPDSEGAHSELKFIEENRPR